MAGTITFAVSVFGSNGGSFRFNGTGAQAGAKYLMSTQTIGLVEEELDFGDIAEAKAWLAVRNKDPTNTVALRLVTGSILNFIMEPSRCFFGVVGANCTQVFAVATVAPCEIEYAIWEA